MAPVVSWREERELLEMVNGTETGLAAYFYARPRGLQLAEAVEPAWSA